MTLAQDALKLYSPTIDGDVFGHALAALDPMIHVAEQREAGKRMAYLTFRDGSKLLMTEDGKAKVQLFAVPPTRSLS